MPQSLSQIFIHSIFSTKERYAFLRDMEIRSNLYAYIAQILKSRGANAIIVGGTSDHVHILHLLSKNEPISQLIREVKRSSSISIKEGGDAMLSKFHWQRGYGSFSVSKSNVDSVYKYIQRQEEHHKQISFKNEYRAFLEKHQVEYDEKYVWD
jgi:putative transposase